MAHDPPRYDIETGHILFRPGERMDLAELAGRQTPWWNRTVASVNDAWVRLAVMDGDFHWHQHDREDEFFLVLEGRLVIELPDRTVTLGPHEGVTIARGTRHCPHAIGRTVVLLVEQAGVEPTGDRG